MLMSCTMVDSQSPDDITSRGYSYLADGDVQKAITDFENVLETGRLNRRAIHGLAVACAMAGQYERFFGLFNDSYFLHGNDLEIGLNIFLSVVSRENGFKAIKSMYPKLPDGHPAKVLATYHIGCAELKNNNIDTAFDYFDKFRNAVIAQKEIFPITADQIMNVMFRQALLIERSGIVKQIESADGDTFPPYSPQWQFDTAPVLPANMQEPIFISCCNGIYFNQFAPDFVRSIDQYCRNAIVHIHIAEPNIETHQIIRGLRDTHGDLRQNYSIESGSPYSGNVYFACNRFLLAEKFLDLYQNAITIFDIDGELNTSPDTFVKAVNHCDVACFSSGRTEPASVYQAAAVFFANTKQGKRFSRLMRKFILMKLALPPALSWMLDQAALFSVIHYLASENAELNFKDLTRSEGLTLTNIFTPVEAPEEKLKLMQLGEERIS